MAAGPRVTRYADDWVAAHREFAQFVESLSDEQWHMAGKNFPEQINGEDESRSIGVIAHHVADTEPFIIDRIYLMLEGKPLPRVDFHDVNARHSASHSDVTRGDVLDLLRSNEQSIPPRVRAIPDEALDVEHQTPVGPATIAQRLERTLIGHLKMHEGSIRAALA